MYQIMVSVVEVEQFISFVMYSVDVLECCCVVKQNEEVNVVFEIVIEVIWCVLVLLDVVEDFEIEVLCVELMFVEVVVDFCGDLIVVCNVFVILEVVQVVSVFQFVFVVLMFFGILNDFFVEFLQLWEVNLVLDEVIVKVWYCVENFFLSIVQVQYVIDDVDCQFGVVCGFIVGYCGWIGVDVWICLVEVECLCVDLFDLFFVEDMCEVVFLQVCCVVYFVFEVLQFVQCDIDFFCFFGQDWGGGGWGGGLWCGGGGGDFVFGIFGGLVIGSLFDGIFD